MVSVDSSVLFVPLRSNAAQLVAGAPVAAIRRKLKYASLVYDELWLENGTIRIQAGQGGSSTFDTGEEAFQTVAERRAGMKGGFQLAVGLESTPGVAAPAESMRTVMASPTATIAWRPTLIPFDVELPVTCDWVRWIDTMRSSEVSKLASSWSLRDRSNDALLSAVPDSFTRSLIIDHTNFDLARAALNGVPAMQDATHRQVLSARLDSTTTWRPTGFAVPVLAPRVGYLAWSEIAKLRADRAIRYYRGAMHDLEMEALEVCADGEDVERVLNVLLQKRLAKLAEPPRGAGSVLFNGAVSFFVGAGIGAATAGWSGSSAICGGAALGTVFDVGLESVHMARARAARSWVSLHQKLSE
jgi:hypothetical protein